MDAQKTIKKYILPKTMTIISALLVVIGLVLAVLGIVAMSNADTEALEFYPDESATNSMAYIDVVAVSDWAYQYDEAVYYTAMDADGYLYTVRLNDSVFKQMAEQNEYWNTDDENAVAPAPFRLEGVVKDASNDTRDSMAEAWDMTAEEYYQYFGHKYIDATTNSRTEALGPWLFGAIMFCLFGIVFLFLSGKANRNAKKCLARLEELGMLERAAQQVEMTDSNTIIGKNRGMLSRDFLFGKGTGMVVAYSDILWAYQQDRKRNLVPVNSYLMVGTMATAVEGAVDLNRNDRHGYIAEALEIIGQRNPEAMIGYSRDFAKAFNAIRKGQ